MKFGNSQKVILKINGDLVATNLLVLIGATGHDLRVLSTSATRMAPLACVVMVGADVRLNAHGLRPAHARPPPAHRCCCCWTSRGCGPCSLRARRPLPPPRISRRICSTSSLLYAHMTAAAAAAAAPSPAPSATTVAAVVAVAAVAVAAVAAVVVSVSVLRSIRQPSPYRHCRRRQTSSYYHMTGY